MLAGLVSAMLASVAFTFGCACAAEGTDGSSELAVQASKNNESSRKKADTAVIFFISCPPRLKDLLKTHGGNRDCLYYNRFGGEMFYSSLNVVFLSCIFYRAVLDGLTISFFTEF